MADCHDLFQKFHEKIKLTSTKEEYLKKSREACRDEIRKYFKDEKKEKIPEFCGQGSYLMRTMVNPLSGEYDIDDGVYLMNLPEEMIDWPRTEKVHEWIKKSVKEKTTTAPIDKKNCVRIIYANDYHVDLPIYGKYDGVSYLASLGDDQWVPSEPIELANWFVKKVQGKGEQLRTMVQYLKAWADQEPKKMPNGLILSVLTVNNYVSDERDDISFSSTVENIFEEVKNTFKVINPVDPNEDLTDRLTEKQKENFKESLEHLIESCNEALSEENKEKAAEIWEREFGDRFPKSEEEKEDKRTPIIISQPASPHCILSPYD